MQDKIKPAWANTLLAKADITIGGNRPWDIVVHNQAIYKKVISTGSLGLGEAYMNGWWDCQDLAEFFYKVFKARLKENIGFSWPLFFDLVKAKVFNLQSLSRAFQVAQKHYDLGNDFFAAMLGPSMVYTCGYWNEAKDLAAAQYAKMDLVCKKLNLKPGQKILDIGSGWGSFARHAATHYGVSVVGVTVSKEQLPYAQEFCKDLPVEFRLQDYRQVNEKFDHIISIGMFEAVGHKNMKTYIQVARRCLKDNGLFLLHTIGNPTSGTHLDPWMDKYIFPNGHIPSLAQITKSIEGLFLVEDVHNFGAYYEKTLLAWHQNFKQHWPEFKDQYGEKFYRMWEYYLLQCVALFRARQMQLWQIVLSPHGVPGGYQSIR